MEYRSYCMAIRELQWNIVHTAWQFVNCATKVCLKKLIRFLSTSITCIQHT